MDYSNEQHFVQAFIRKSRRDRLLYELTTPQKRYGGVSRFCHQAKELLASSDTVYSGMPKSRANEARIPYVEEDMDEE